MFQLESEGMRKLLAKLRPDCFEDLIAVLAMSCGGCEDDPAEPAVVGSVEIAAYQDSLGAPWTLRGPEGFTISGTTALGNTITRNSIHANRDGQVAFEGVPQAWTRARRSRLYRDSAL